MQQHFTKGVVRTTIADKADAHFTSSRTVELGREFKAEPLWGMGDMGTLERKVNGLRQQRIRRARELATTWPHTFDENELRHLLVDEDPDDNRSLATAALDVLDQPKLSTDYQATKTHDREVDPQPTNYSILSDVGLPNTFLQASPTAPEMWVYAVDDGLAVGPARNEVVLDSTGAYVPHVTRAAHLTSLFDDVEATHLSGTALMVRTPGAVMFSHWLYDLLPRVEAARCAGYGPDKVDHILVNGREFGYEFETLEALGYPKEKVTHIKAGSPAIKADRLIVPTYPRSTEKSKHTPSWARDLVRSTFLPQLDGDPPRPTKPKVVYLSRQSAARRRIVPHDQLDEFLADFDAVWIEPENLTVRQVAEELQDAALFIGPHGAGLANGVFLPSWAGSIEFIGAQFMLEHFHVLTSTAAFYVGVSGTDEGDDVFSDEAIARMDHRTNTENQELDILLDRHRAAEALDWARSFLADYGNT